MADELGSGDLLLGAMPKKFQILKKTGIGFLKIHSKSHECFDEIYAFYAVSNFRILPDSPDILFDASCIRMGNPLPLENQ